jgi:YfiH family protein
MGEGDFSHSAELSVSEQRREAGNFPGRSGDAPSAGAGVGVWRAADWRKYTWLRHGFSTRAGGVSEIYGGAALNLGWTREDDAARVAENRRRFLTEIAGGPARLVTLRQVHSEMIRVVEAGDSGLETADGRAVLEGDGMLTDVPGVMLGIQVADCVPVLVADVRRKAVGAFHAGWRGTLKRIVEHGIGTMRSRYGSQPEDLVAAIGPSIGACCYSVGDEVVQEFTSQFAYAADIFSERYDLDPTTVEPEHSNRPQIHLDLWEANRRQLLDAGVDAERVTVVGECSACSRTEDGARKYFSHRAERGFAGRMMGVIGVKGTDE